MHLQVRILEAGQYALARRSAGKPDGGENGEGTRAFQPRKGSQDTQYRELSRLGDPKAEARPSRDL